MGPVVTVVQLAPRRPGWERRLAAYLDSVRAQPFVWGRFDCCLHACDAALAMTGHDYAAEYRGYDSKRAAFVILRRVGGGGIAEAIARALGDPLAYPLLARRGDAVLVDSAHGDALAVCTGRQIAAVAPERGLTFLPLSAAKLAWRV